MSANGTKILQVGRIEAGFDARLAATWDVIPLWTDAGRARLEAEAAEISVVATGAGLNCPGSLIDRLPNLRAIANFGVGYDAVDVATAVRRGIVVSNTPNVLNDCVADLGFALVLDVMRRTTAGDRYVRAGGWEKAPFPLATRVSGKKLGIVGLGRIGRVLARRAAGFDMEIAYHNRRADPEVAHRWFSSIVDLAGWSDVLVVLTPGGAATRHLISTAELRALGPQGFLVNISRGSVVDEAALIAALEAGEIAGAGLDVFAAEPHVPEALKRRDDVVLLPHVGSATRETRRAMGDLTYDNIASFLATGRLLTPVPETPN